MHLRLFSFRFRLVREFIIISVFHGLISGSGCGNFRVRSLMASSAVGWRILSKDQSPGVSSFSSGGLVKYALWRP